MFYFRNYIMYNYSSYIAIILQIWCVLVFWHYNCFSRFFHQKSSWESPTFRTFALFSKIFPVFLEICASYPYSTSTLSIALLSQLFRSSIDQNSCTYLLHCQQFVFSYSKNITPYHSDDSNRSCQNM